MTIESRKSDSHIWLGLGDTTQMITFKEFTFEAAHMTPPYSTLHGHTFKVELQFSGTPDPTYGWAVCLDDVQNDVNALRAVIDNKYLNDIPGLQIPSLENVARWIFDRLAATQPGLSRVMLSRGFEGQKEGCVYEGGLAQERRAAA
jgi:6-pyruvoyltetrahydropterin/6-carboxytetrahydropterin synthase